LVPRRGAACRHTVDAAERLATFKVREVLHGVGAPLAGTCPAPDGHAAAFADDIASLEPLYISEHLNVSHFRRLPDLSPQFSGFLLPPLQSSEGVDLAVSNIRARRAAFGNIPLAIETPVSYLPLLRDEWTDGDFVAAIAEQANCDIVLDLHNVLCNDRNGRQDLEVFCASNPLERVWELHLADGAYDDGFYLDAHRHRGTLAVGVHRVAR
jgi:uncharacterized protein